MLFSSYVFLLFFPVIFFLYWFVFNKKLASQNILLLIASYIFYGWWSWKFIFLLLFSTLLDYAYGFGVASLNRPKAKFFLWLSVINNIGVLFIFKYFNFFSSEVSHGLGLLGIHVEPVILNFALPVGISFYTFHGLSYVFDIYHKERKPVTNVSSPKIRYIQKYKILHF
jgi:D-alanyl-lipoteichoic acid acyltransferase DltB (MBOAT superfamily)